MKGYGIDITELIAYLEDAYRVTDFEFNKMCNEGRTFESFVIKVIRNNLANNIQMLKDYMVVTGGVK